MKYLFRTFSFAFIGRKVLPPPSNLHYSFGQLCKLKWTWNPPEGMNSGCDLEYCSEILINGIPQENREWSRNLFREEDVSLNEEAHFRVRSECKSDNTSEPSNWVEISTPPKETDFSSLLGEGAGGKTSTAALPQLLWKSQEVPAVLASIGYDGLGNNQQCQNYIYGDNFGCNFSLSIQNSTHVYPTISILIRDNSEEIRPVCANRNPTTIGKMREMDAVLKLHCTVTPSDNKNYYTTPEWGLKPEPGGGGQSPSLTIPGEHTDFTFYIVLILTVPLTVAVATIILLVYLKRLKILIYPQIPDPRKIIKRMFGEQIEDFQSCPGDDFLNVRKPAMEEEIHYLVWIENPESSTSDNEDRERPALQVKAL
ncbi:Interleukin-13 receptor subunit alpha-1 [Chelonia mydas]|uniref:Interleukin-13 receptor subunit alpha-1 n=1 Tax=Chelonia mydas TaxID=8469 RepID=M7BMS4_CHEMY|nr:Interleukin-13 receptor subunit alpha-1 [Chelonia mydas]